MAQPPDSRAPSLTVPEQIHLLKSEGMRFLDEARAAHYLDHINYSRLKAYWLPLTRRNPGTSRGKYTFAEGVTFESVLALYGLDRKLRLTLLDAIERFEISLRSRFSNVLGRKYGPHCLEQVGHFNNAEEHHDGLRMLLREARNEEGPRAAGGGSQGPATCGPPIWEACEMLTFGQLVRWLENLRLVADREAVCATYGFDLHALLSFATHTVQVRNSCAHQKRLWNERLGGFQLPSSCNHPFDLAMLDRGSGEKIYNTLVMLSFVLRIIAPGSGWHRRLFLQIHNAAQAAPGLDVAREMGFPSDWEARVDWLSIQ